MAMSLTLVCVPIRTRTGAAAGAAAGVLAGAAAAATAGRGPPGQGPAAARSARRRATTPRPPTESRAGTARVDTWLAPGTRSGLDCSVWAMAHTERIILHHRLQ